VDFIKNRGNEWNALDYHSCKSHHPFNPCSTPCEYSLTRPSDFVFAPRDIAESAMAHITDVTLNGAVGSKLMDAGMSIGGNIYRGQMNMHSPGHFTQYRREPYQCAKTILRNPSTNVCGYWRWLYFLE
jgi:hypothetical protein